jgi:hypothetical protein
VIVCQAGIAFSDEVFAHQIERSNHAAHCLLDLLFAYRQFRTLSNTSVA